MSTRISPAVSEKSTSAHIASISSGDSLDGKVADFCEAGDTLDYFPADINLLSRCRPIYETLPGWKESTAGVTDFNSLPQNARFYLRRIEELSGAEIDIISTGADRLHTITLRHPFG